MAHGLINNPVEMEDEHKVPSPHTVHRMDHGLEAWLQVLGSWILFANTW